MKSSNSSTRLHFVHLSSGQSFSSPGGSDSESLLALALAAGVPTQLAEQLQPGRLELLARVWTQVGDPQDGQPETEHCSAPTPLETELLSEGVRAQGWRLASQCRLLDAPGAVRVEIRTSLPRED